MKCLGWRSVSAWKREGSPGVQPNGRGLRGFHSCSAPFHPRGEAAQDSGNPAAKLNVGLPEKADVGFCCPNPQKRASKVMWADG